MVNIGQTPNTFAFIIELGHSPLICDTISEEGHPCGQGGSFVKGEEGNCFQDRLVKGQKVTLRITVQSVSAPHT